MKKHTLAGSICAVLLSALGAPTVAAQTSATATILFTRTLYRAIDGTHGSALYRINPSGEGLALLAPVTYGVDYRGGSWSPSGSAVVYESVASSQSSSQLYVVDRQGGSPHAITTGPGLHTQPAWGPTSGTIAFVTNASGQNCLGSVSADGTNQRIVFCPPRESGMGKNIDLSAPRWTASGTSVLVVAGANEGGLEPSMWYSNVYRVNISTGAAVKLAGQVFTNSDERDLAIAPDDTHGVYSGYPMYAIDFASNTRRPLSTYGSDLMYSPDGTRVAFLKAPFTYPYYTNVYVMDADGSHIHKALTQTDSTVTYPSIADWSFDSTRLLVNQVGDDRLLKIIDLRNHTATTLTKGTADADAWFHP